MSCRGIAVQLLRRAGATVVAIASEAGHAWLAGKGAIPIAYGPNLETFHIDAFIELHGPRYLDLAIELGVPPSRINTIISFAKTASIGTRTNGSMAGTSRKSSARRRGRSRPHRRDGVGFAPPPT